MLSLTSKEQLSVSVSPGLMNYGGDLQPYYWAFAQSDLSISAGISIQLTQHFNIRSELTYGKLKASDSQYPENSKRNLSFHTNISEINLCVEYDIINPSHKLDPYFFAGAGIFHYDPYTFTASGLKVHLQPVGTEGQGLPEYPDRLPYDLTQANILLGAGFKYRISQQFAVGIEFCSRYLLTDYLDDVSQSYPVEADLLNHGRTLAAELSFRGDELDPSEPFPDGRRRGNKGATDNYYTSMLRIMYTFPKTNFEGLHFGKGRTLRCPKEPKLF